jgi:hypothetical protein
LFALYVFFAANCFSCGSSISRLILSALPKSLSRFTPAATAWRDAHFRQRAGTATARMWKADGTHRQRDGQAASCIQEFFWPQLNLLMDKQIGGLTVYLKLVIMAACSRRFTVKG